MSAVEDARVRPWTQGPGGLRVGGVEVGELVARAGSPLYVLDGETLAGRVRALHETLGAAGARLYFAGKANPNPGLWRRLRDQGLGLDACSPGEVAQARKAGFADDEISFTGCGLTLAEMDELAATEACVNLDAADQALAFSRRHPGRPFGLRVNPGQGAGSHASCTTAGSDAKLGVPEHEVRPLIAQLRSEGAAFRGLHCHTGSGGLDVEHFVEVAARMEALAEEVGDLDWLSLGGGLGVPHHPRDPAFDLPRYAEALRGLAARRPGAASDAFELRLEPGQAVVAEAGVLVMTVVSRKQQPDGTRFLITDSSFNHYLGTSLYASWHGLVADLPAGAARDEEETHVVGHLCNTGDVFARARRLPALEVGERLLMETCGAYGISRAATYNSRPLPAEVLVEGGAVRLLRARQGYEDLDLWYRDEVLA